MFSIPHPCLRVDRLTDRTEQPQRTEVVLGRLVGTPLHERSDRCRSGVEDRDLVLINDLPQSIVARKVGNAFVHHLRRTVTQRAIHDVAVSRDPTDIGGAPEDVGLRVEVEHVFVRVGGVREVATCCMHNALGLAGGTARIQQKQQVLGAHRLRRANGRRALHQIVVPMVASLDHRDGIAATLDDNNVFNRRRLSYGFVCCRFEWEHFTSAIAAVSRDQYFRLGVVDPITE